MRHLLALQVASQDVSRATAVWRCINNCQRLVHRLVVCSGIREP